VCKRTVGIIGGSHLLQYRLKLRRSGMEDGPLSTLSIPERRERLQAYNNSWKYLRWSGCVELPNIGDSTHCMDIDQGGIVTFVPLVWWKERKIIFVRVPSVIRGVPTRQWELSFEYVRHLCRYAFDPCEDILVLLRR